LKSIGMQSGDEVILSAYDYPGNFWAIEAAGANPVLIDVLPQSTTVSIEQLQQAWSPRTRACIVSHLHGEVQDCAVIANWAEQQKVILIEDCCQALGATIAGKRVGSLTSMAIVSFGGSKVLSAGRGGALICREEHQFQRCKLAAGVGSGAWLLSELAASVVLAQWPYLEQINQQCRIYFEQLAQSLDRQALRFLAPSAGQQAVYYQAGWIAPTAEDRQRLVQSLAMQNIPAGAGFVGFHRRSARRCRSNALVNAPDLVQRLMVLHFSIAMDNRFTPSQLASAIGQAARS
jgi:dTDP-4-amino-4,6-dideoxygalactose transaminase